MPPCNPSTLDTNYHHPTTIPMQFNAMQRRDEAKRDFHNPCVSFPRLLFFFEGCSKNLSGRRSPSLLNKHYDYVIVDIQCVSFDRLLRLHAIPSSSSFMVDRIGHEILAPYYFILASNIYQTLLDMSPQQWKGVFENRSQIVIPCLSSVNY